MSTLFRCLLVLFLVGVAHAQIFSPPKPEETPEKPVPAESEQEEVALEKLFERMRRWPAKSAREAALVAVGLGDAARERLIVSLADHDWRVQASSAFALGEVKEKQAMGALRAAVAQESNRASLPEMLRAIVKIDPDKGPQILLPFLAHRESRVRNVARKALPKKLPKELLPTLKELTTNRRAAVRQMGLELLGSFKGEKLASEFLLALGDPHSRVARTAVDWSAESDEPELEKELQAAAAEGPSRQAAFACLALVAREDRQGTLLMDDQGAIRKRLIGFLASRDAFYRGVGAVGLSNISYRSDDVELRKLADESLVPALLMTVAGGTFFSDYTAVESFCWEKLELLTGAGHGARASAWLSWWREHQDGFVARRELKSLRPTDLLQADLVVRHFTDEGEGSVVGLTGDASRAVVSDELLWLPAADHGRVLKALEKADLFSTTGGESPEGSGERWEFSVRLPDSSMNFHRIQMGALPEELDALKSELVAIKRDLAWQQLCPLSRGSSQRLWFQEQAEWFAANSNPESRQDRMRRLALEGWDKFRRSGRLAGLDILSQAPKSWLLSHQSQLVDVLKSDDTFSSETEQLASRLRGSGSAALEDAVLGVAANSPSLRAAEFLRSVIDPYPKDRLLFLLGDARERIRAQAARSLKRFGSEAGVADRLIQVLGDPDVMVREAALDTLAQLKDSRTLSVIEGVLTGDDPGLRVRGIEALARIGGEQSVGRLMQLYRSSDARGQWAVIQALPRAGGATAARSLGAIARETDSAHPYEALSALTRMDHEDVPAVLATVLEKAPSKNVRAVAMDNLVLVAGKDAAPTLKPYAAKTDDPFMSRLASLSLARLGQTDVLPALLELLEKPDGDMAAEAALGTLTFFQDDSPSPPIRAKEYRDWANRFGQLDRTDWFLMAADKAGVSLDNQVSWLEEPELDSSLKTRMLMLLELGNRPLREFADAQLRRALGVEWTPIAEDQEGVTERIREFKKLL